MSSAKISTKSASELRDHFAAMALAGMGMWAPSRYNIEDDDVLLSKARYAYRVADAMLKAREETPNVE